MLKGEPLWKIRKIFFDVFCPRRMVPARIAWLRSIGVRLGEGCKIYTDHFVSEPYLVDIGNRVGISAGTRLITHDGSVDATVRGRALIFGRIVIGDDTFIGVNCLILPGTVIGRDCIIGAGSVVRGTIPDGSVVMGNPAAIVMSTKMAQALSERNRNRIDLQGLSPEKRERAIREHFGLSEVRR